MNNNDIGFNASDAWLLLSLLYAGYPVDRKRIEEVGDGINHAIFTDKEFKDGIKRLISAGYVNKSNKLYSPTKTVIDWYKKVSPKRSYIQKDLARIEKFLTIHSR